MARLEGVIVPLVTPYGQNRIDCGSLGELLRRLRGRVGGVFLVSTTGEGPLLSREEKLELVRCGLEAGVRPLLAGAPEPSTPAAVELALRLADLGVDGIVVVSPYYYPLRDEHVLEHYRRVVEAVEVPVVLYTIPSHTCNKPSPQVFGRLAREYSHVVGVKVTSPDISYLVGVARELEGTQATLLPGDARALPVAHALGSRASVLGVANILPVSAQTATLEGPGAGGEAFRRLVRALELLQGPPFPCALKHVLAKLGVLAGAECRPPLAGALPGDALEALTRMVGGELGG